MASSEMVMTGPSLKPTPLCHYISTKSCHDDMPAPSVSETGSNAADVECAQATSSPANVCTVANQVMTTEAVDSRENGNTSNQPAVGKYPAPEVLSEEQSLLHPSNDPLGNEGNPACPPSGPIYNEKVTGSKDLTPPGKDGSSKHSDPKEMVCMGEFVIVKG